MGMKMTHSGSLGMQHSITVSDDVLEHVFSINKTSREITIRKEDEKKLLDEGMKNLTKAKSLIDKEAEAAYTRLRREILTQVDTDLKTAIDQWKTSMKAKAENYFHMPQHGALDLLTGDGLPAMIDSLEGKKTKSKYSINDAIKRNISIKCTK